MKALSLLDVYNKVRVNSMVKKFFEFNCIPLEIDTRVMIHNR